MQTIGVIYYLCTFGKCLGCAWHELSLILLNSSVMDQRLYPRIISCELITLTSGVAFLICIELSSPDSTVPSPRNVRSKSKRFSCCDTLTQSRTGWLLHSILASRVLLDIRAKTGDKLVRSDGLTELNTDHLCAGNTQSSRLESIRFTTWRGRPLQCLLSQYGWARGGGSLS